MGRSKNKTKRPARVEPTPVASTSEPTYTTSELLLQAAQHVASCEYELAKAVSVAAVNVANDVEDVKGLMDSLEILGTVELELGELDEAREVREFFGRA